jgi:hypothetical protein
MSFDGEIKLRQYKSFLYRNNPDSGYLSLQSGPETLCEIHAARPQKRQINICEAQVPPKCWLF